MIFTLMMATAVAAAPAASPTPGLPITGVSAGQKMPAGVTHIEAPPLRAFRIQATPTATPSPTPRTK